jgi:hypothetical protein
LSMRSHRQFSMVQAKKDKKQNLHNVFIVQAKSNKKQNLHHVLCLFKQLESFCRNS